MVFLLFCSASYAASDTLTNDLQLIPDEQALWRESLLWDKDVVLRTGFGYKDNVLLAPNGRQGSAFVTSGLDFTLFRLPLDGWEVSLTLIGDDVRYFHSPGGLKGEDLLAASGQIQRYWGSGWRAGIEQRYSYVDQVLQELVISGGVQAIEAKGQSLGFRPFFRRDLGTNWWVQLEAPLARDWWQSPLDSTWKLGGQAVLGYSYGSHSQISASGGWFYIPHDRWLARDAAGTELPGRILSLQREVAELKWEHQWDSSNHWSSATRLGFNQSHDNGGGFFNYDRYYVSQEVRFHTRNWEAKVSGGWSNYDFPIQTIAAPPAPKLHLDTVNAIVHLERRVFKSIHLFASYEFEQTASNDPAGEYRYNIVTGGLNWEF